MSEEELRRRGFHAAADAKARQRVEDYYMGEAARWDRRAPARKGE